MTNKKWQMVIGLEVHAQVSTKSKLFSRGSTEYGQEPNTCTDYLDLGLPGALPVLNQACIRKAVMTGHALHMTLNQKSSFDRKHYFYPDLPLGYQITQFYEPIAQNGYLPIWVNNEIKNVQINRIHLETDAGKSIHKNGKTYIDLNRCGVPLMEIVTEPDMHGPEEAATFLRVLQATLKSIGSCDGNMEKGQLRADLNISLHKPGEKFGTRVEVKNINSANFLKKAIMYEYERQSSILDSGGIIQQETRLFNEKETIYMRTKEDSEDYRYMPDPDLPPLVLNEEELICKSDVRLPYNVCKEIARLGIKLEEAWIVAENQTLSDIFFEAGKGLNNEEKLILFKWLIGDVLSFINKNDGVEIDLVHLRNLILLLSQEKISGKVAKDLLIEFIETKQDPYYIVKEKGLEQISDINEITKIVSDIMQNYDKEIAEYKNGKDNLKQFFIGKILAATQGKLNPRLTQEVLENYLHIDK
ncbi:MAG: Asp-tRNA(Asn)/Glu-tRNA(Gln) amidotransferase subunit GatB [Alphaproteobacteria bacterium]|nr:MAG: Asp-tRNA(Asn)/Glu-tRNA(Gln) amidotransferase subunit GatB [Alphaproteobacteria bacterium]